MRKLFSERILSGISGKEGMIIKKPKMRRIVTAVIAIALVLMMVVPLVLGTIM